MISPDKMLKLAEGNDEMLGKPIIIDGVDVAGCMFFNSENMHCYYANTMRNCYSYESEPCKGDICYYKQLQTAKIENEIIMKRLQAYEEDADVQIALSIDAARLETLEAENSGLKNRIADLLQQKQKLEAEF